MIGVYWLVGLSFFSCSKALVLCLFVLLFLLLLYLFPAVTFGGGGFRAGGGARDGGVIFFLFSPHNIFLEVCVPATSHLYSFSSFLLVLWFFPRYYGVRIQCACMPTFRNRVPLPNTI
ncbi:hypothetical protein DFP73DRAFT_99438 [Morchella snyderi]|nr:hypothetical protein DFP73DRAFT_99438 [Morchella snyderi]